MLRMRMRKENFLAHRLHHTSKMRILCIAQKVTKELRLIQH